jgi:hypothetical protein
MSLEQIILTKNILLVLIPVLLVVVLMNTDWKKGVSKVSDAGNDFAGRILKKSKLNYFNYDSIQKYLNTRGATYMFGEFATPVTYMTTPRRCMPTRTVLTTVITSTTTVLHSVTSVVT